MSDPIEERLRSHLTARAAQVTVEPDAAALADRAAARPRVGTPLVAGLVALVVVLTGGGFLTGRAVAGSSPVRAAPAAGALAPAAGASGLPNADVGGTAGDGPPLMSLFTRTTGTGVTIRAYRSSTDGSCSSMMSCPPTGTLPSPAPVPTPVPCPTGATCAQPVEQATSTPGAATGASAGTSTGESAGGGSASSGTVTTTPPSTGSGCQQLTVEFSTDQAVSSTTLAAPTQGALTASEVEILGSGSFGEAEGAPAAWVAVLVGSSVTSVHLVTSTGSVLDAMAPASGVAVLAAVGSTALAATSVIGIEQDGTTGAVPSDQGAGTSGPGCSTVPVVPPPSTTTTTTTTGPSTTGSTTATTVPTPSTLVPATATPAVARPTGAP